jgi:hypothetical protein
MDLRYLTPQFSLLREEFVLIQAWKKTSAYIRAHNWYADTLALDRAAVSLPQFLDELKTHISREAGWTNDEIRIVPAPKSQKWRISDEGRGWEPAGPHSSLKLRPLAHVSLKDQVIATAVMMCLADRVETIQGDPRTTLTDLEARRSVVSYGSRLFCDQHDRELHHRWGSRKLYREYFEDYRRFLKRPEEVAQPLVDADKRVVIVQSDLRQFYDRVRPGLLSDQLGRLRRDGDDPKFFEFAQRLFHWRWAAKDLDVVHAYQTQAGIPDFASVALPQGLVSAGFFSNVVLLDFDRELQKAIGTDIDDGIRLEDVSRYVDDMRLVLSVPAEAKLGEIQNHVFAWLEQLLAKTAPGLEPSEDKTLAISFGTDEKTFVRQSRKMQRIQKAISGGFDAIAGQEILEAVQGLMRSQQRFSKSDPKEPGWVFSPVPDVGDATVARFAAGRFRSTYRSLRLLLPTEAETSTIAVPGDEESGEERFGAARTQGDLDDEARTFALGLIENWIFDPSNVRLLRIGLDIWPAKDVLESVLALFRPFTEKGGRRNGPKRVAWYCLAEVFRAGATETGFVGVEESLPESLDIAGYRDALRDEALRLMKDPTGLPWYLRQQVLLFLAAHGQSDVPMVGVDQSSETKDYVSLIHFLRGRAPQVGADEFARLAVLARRAFLGAAASEELLRRQLDVRRVERIARIDPDFALELVTSNPALRDGLSPRVSDDLCLMKKIAKPVGRSLTELVVDGGVDGRLRNDEDLLRFALKFLEIGPDASTTGVVTPNNIWFEFSGEIGEFSHDYSLRITPNRKSPRNSCYRCPEWCRPEERWRFQLGYILRFILTARVDYTKPVRSPHWKEAKPIYRAPDSHWYQRIHGLFNGHSAFGDDWLPISDWTERLLAALLSWPGCRPSEMSRWLDRDALSVLLEQQIKLLSKDRGPLTNVLMMRLNAPRPLKETTERPIRACVVQCVIPGFSDFTVGDLSLSAPAIRKRTRNHLSTALAAVERMLDLRETHKARGGRLDWLILPELSVHPDDVTTHLVPFARKHKAIILAGLTYEVREAETPLVNAATWVIPVWSHEFGLQVIKRRQGKQHLAPEEERAFNSGAKRVRGFRPCQWLVGYEWSLVKTDAPLWLTASVCFDSTDIRLAGDLRDRSDILAIPALNKDVGTFDQMAQALHYHMYQMVVVANNGEFGGSNAYAPYKEQYHRQVFHLHGQPQASVAFFEIDNIGDFLRRGSAHPAQHVPPPSSLGTDKWKPKPAGHGRIAPVSFRPVTSPIL